MRLKTNNKWGWGLFQKTLSQSYNQAPTGELYPTYRSFVLSKFNPFSFLSEWSFQKINGRNMKWSYRPRKKVGWGICKRLNSPPKITNLLSRIFLWSFIWKEGRTLFSKTNKGVRYNRFFKYISLRIIKFKGAINYVRRKGAYSKSPQVGYGHYEGKRLVCSVLGNGVRGWSFNTSTLY